VKWRINLLFIGFRKYTIHPRGTSKTRAHQTIIKRCQTQFKYNEVEILDGIELMEVEMTTHTLYFEVNPDLIELEQTNLESLGDLEAAARVKTNHLMRSIIAQWLEACEEDEPRPQTRCRQCGLLANYVSMRSAFIRTQFGLVRYHRAYYVCPHCHTATCPLDERLNPIESLARLRAKLFSGIPLPVAEIAKDWGLGSLEQKPS
jgi:hypothetical protein